MQGVEYEANSGIKYDILYHKSLKQLNQLQLLDWLSFFVTI